MYAVTILGAPAWLLTDPPNTSDSVSLKVSIELDTQRGLTGRSSRRPQAYLNRHELGWVSMMTPAAFYAARAAILSANDEPVVAPFWPAVRNVADAAAMTSQLTVAWTRDWSSYAINPPSLVGYDYWAPLLMGLLSRPPRLTGKNASHVLAEWNLKEDAPAAAALIPPADGDTTLATPDGYAAAVFPFTPEGSNAPLLTFGQIDVDRQQIGPGRETAEIYYPQARETVAQPSFKLKSSADVIALMGWWQRRGGGADSFWVATTQKVADLTADIAVGATTVPVAAAISGLKAGDTLALLTTGIAPEFVRVQSIVDGIPQLAGPTAVAHPQLWTTVVPALLAHHADADLSLDLRRAANDWIATCTLIFREVSPEYAATDGEVRGTTLGKLPPNAWLARIDLDYAGATESWYITNWEGGGTTPDNQVWDYHPFDFDQVTQSIDLEDDNCTLKIRWWDGCPWENWLPGQLSATGTLTLFRAPIAADGSLGNAVQVWSGLLSTPQMDGPILSVTVLGANSMFGRKAPHAMMRPTCWKRFCGGLCRLSSADWTFNASIAAIAANVITIGTITRANGGGLPAGFGAQDWFALGWLQWTDGSGHPLRASIIGSAALSGGQIALTVDRTLSWQVGQSVVALPGCDKTKDTCDSKFGNLFNFGGFFAMPAVSPNFVIPNTSSTPAKK